MINALKKMAACLTYTLCLFIIMLSLSSFTLESHNNKQEIMLILMWICTTFVLQISTSNLFASDYNDGVLEQFFIQPPSSELIIIYKIFAHWLLFGLPISVISFIFSFIVLDHSIGYSITIGLSLLFNTLIIINISATGHALIIGKSNLASAVSQILVLPMIMPTFIYFKLLIQSENLLQILSITALVFIMLIANSTIATHAALKFAIEHD